MEQARCEDTLPLGVTWDELLEALALPDMPCPPRFRTRQTRWSPAPLTGAALRAGNTALAREGCTLVQVGTVSSSNSKALQQWQGTRPDFQAVPDGGAHDVGPGPALAKQGPPLHGEPAPGCPRQGDRAIHTFLQAAGSAVDGRAVCTLIEPEPCQDASGDESATASAPLPASPSAQGQQGVLSAIFFLKRNTVKSLRFFYV